MAEAIYIIFAFLFFTGSLIFFSKKIKVPQKKADQNLIPQRKEDVDSDSIKDKELERLSEKVKQLQATLHSLEERLKSTKSKSKELESINKSLNEQKYQLEIRLKQIEKIRDRKEEVLSMFIHDLRSPVTAIRMLTDLMNAFESTIEEQNKSTEILLKASEKVIDIANRIVNEFEENEHEKNTQIKSVSMKQILQDVYLYNIVKARAKNIIIKLNVSDYIPNLKVDSLKISEVIDNILDNAIKYSPESGEVKINAHSDRSRLLISVCDEGPGIDKNSVEKIFKKGFKNGSTEFKDSNGMGLYIAKTYIDEHNGKIYLNKENNSGTMISFELPITEN